MAKREICSGDSSGRGRGRNGVKKSAVLHWGIGGRSHVIHTARAAIITLPLLRPLREIAIWSCVSISHLLLRKRHGEVSPGKTRIYLPIESRMNT